MIQNFIWDFDGTLYDTYPAMVRAAEETFQHFGQKLKASEIYQGMKKESLHYLIEEHNLEIAEFKALFHQIEADYLLESKPFPEVKEILETISADGGQHFILTHRKVSTTRNLLERAHLVPYFREVIGLDSGFPRKPAPDAIFYLLKQYQLAPDETMIIGDRKLDIAAGKNAGIQTCLYDIDGFLGKISANLLIHHLSEMI